VIGSPLRRAYRVTGFVGLTVAMLPLYLAHDAVAAPGQREAVRDRWIRRWSGVQLRLFAISALVDGTPPEGRGTGRLVVANHRSAIDVGLLLHAFGGRMVSRGDISGWPLFGKAAQKVGTIFVDRASTVSGATAIRAMRTVLGNGGTVLVFPEGTTFAGDEVRPFHPGSFIAALRTDAQIVPVGIAYERGSRATFVGETFLRHLSRMAGGPATHVVVRVGGAIAVTPGARAAALASDARAAVQELVTDARTRCDAMFPA
jgi:1-acyl-sn-glycerol-3-phosphate acyltransferase